MDKHLQILDLPDEVRDLVAECELTGRRVLFQRGDRVAVMLISRDEYLAQRETIELSNDAAIRQSIAAAEAEVRDQKIMLVEDIDSESRAANDRIRIADSVHQAILSFPSGTPQQVAQMLVQIDEDPIIGAPLFEPLRGLWSIRQGTLRIVYTILMEGRYVAILHAGIVEERPLR